MRKIMDDVGLKSDGLKRHSLGSILQAKIKYVDCSNDSQESKMLMSKYNVQGYPTVIMNVGDEIVEYDNKVTYSNIESFIGDVLK